MEGYMREMNRGRGKQKEDEAETSRATDDAHCCWSEPRCPQKPLDIVDLGGGMQEGGWVSQTLSNASDKKLMVKKLT
ncbi:hypothetical protein Syun_023762 [Stephania yunnanensis]|uniref:Uncharacterized protein n=1 Tax=Stephania yunnanensis TaxID=152371 RepID=A0AAP0F9L5_9MAGN